MIPLIILLCSIGALVIGLASGWTDLKGLKIPNLHSIGVLGLFALAFGLDYVSEDVRVFHAITSHLMAGGIMFVLTVILYSLKLLGAGDSKLASVYGIWVGLSGLPAFLFYMTVFGGVLGLAALIIQKTKPFKAATPGSWIDGLQGGNGAIPYGTAIAFGAIMGFVHAGYLTF